VHGKIYLIKKSRILFFADAAYLHAVCLIGLFEGSKEEYERQAMLCERILHPSS
jgi:hypothetical protein